MPCKLRRVTSIPGFCLCPWLYFSEQWRSNWSDSDPGHLSAEDAAELQRHASQLRDKLRDAHARMRVQEAELESKDKEIARLKKQLSERAEDKP